MFPRLLAFALGMCLVLPATGQEVVVGTPKKAREKTRAPKPPEVSSAWLDLRQTGLGNRKAQSAPDWVRGVSLVTSKASQTSADTTTFRIQLRPPPGDFQVLSFRLFFEDKAEQRPRIVAADDGGDLVLQTPPLGQGLNVATSETVMVPIAGVSSVDVEVPGDGTGVRAAFLDWMKSGEVLRPVSGEQRFVLPETFASSAPLRAPKEDTSQFGTVTATLAPETIQIGPSVPQGAGFQFGIESQPLAVLLMFEVGSVNIDAPPEVYLNGENLGPVTLTLPELADPGYRGEMKTLITQMRFQYTGWVRAQKVLPAAGLRVGN